jgi:hypothetical protein
MVSKATPLFFVAQLPQVVGSVGDNVQAFWHLRISDLIMIVAVLLAPLVALQVQRLLQMRREGRDRKLHIFRTLMATRASRVSMEHVAALNMIDIEFYGHDRKNKEVIRAWNLYRDHLNTPGDPTAAPATWNEKSNDLFTALLHRMAIVFDYDLDEVLLKKGVYSPRYHGELEDDQLLLRKGLVNLLAGKLPLKMEVISFPATITEQEAQEQRQIRERLMEYLEGKRPMPIVLHKPEKKAPEAQEPA